MLSCSARCVRGRGCPGAHAGKRGRPVLALPACRLKQEIGEAAERQVGRRPLLQRREHHPSEREHREQAGEFVGGKRRIDDAERHTLLVRSLHGVEIRLEPASQDVRDMRIAARHHDDVEQEEEPALRWGREVATHDARHLAPRQRDQLGERVDDVFSWREADRREQQVELAREVRVQRTRGDAGTRCDTGHRRRLVSLARELVQRRVQKRGAASSRGCFRWPAPGAAPHRRRRSVPSREVAPLRPAYRCAGCSRAGLSRRDSTDVLQGDAGAGRRRSCARRCAHAGAAATVSANRLEEVRCSLSRHSRRGVGEDAASPESPSMRWSSACQVAVWVALRMPTSLRSTSNQNVDPNEIARPVISTPRIARQWLKM